MSKNNNSSRLVKLARMIDLDLGRLQDMVTEEYALNGFPGPTKNRNEMWDEPFLYLLYRQVGKLNIKYNALKKWEEDE